MIEFNSITTTGQHRVGNRVNARTLINLQVAIRPMQVDSSKHKNPTIAATALWEDEPVTHQVGLQESGLTVSKRSTTSQIPYAIPLKNKTGECLLGA